MPYMNNGIRHFVKKKKKKKKTSFVGQSLGKEKGHPVKNDKEGKVRLSALFECCLVRFSSLHVQSKFIQYSALLTSKLSFDLIYMKLNVFCLKSGGFGLILQI